VVHGLLYGGSLVRGFRVHLSGGSLVRGFFDRGSLVRRFTCPGVNLSILYIYYDFLYWNWSWVDEKIL